MLLAYQTSFLKNKIKTLVLFSHCDLVATWPGPASTIRCPPNQCLNPLSTTLSCRAHPRSGSVQTSPTSTPMSGRRGRQLPQLPPTGKDRSKSPGCFLFKWQVFSQWRVKYYNGIVMFWWLIKAEKKLDCWLSHFWQGEEEVLIAGGIAQCNL